MTQNNDVFNDWLQNSAAGQYISHWQQQHYDHIVPDVFGYFALQIGSPPIRALQGSRIQHTWQVGGNLRTATDHLQAAAEALPFSADQFDLIAMPHGLELSHQPHAALREVSRVLRPEGKIIITGFNPVRLVGSARPRMPLQDLGRSIGYWRLRDWLHLLNFEVNDAGFGCYLPAFTNPRWYQRLSGVDRIASNTAPYLGGLYWLMATKKVHGAPTLEANWKRMPIQPSRTSVTVNQNQRSRIDQL